MQIQVALITLYHVKFINVHPMVSGWMEMQAGINIFRVLKFSYYIAMVIGWGCLKLV